MPSSPLLLQDAPETGAAGSTLVEAQQPLITGDVKYLWSGVIAVAVIFILVFWLLGRWRAGARTSPRRSFENTDFFQPAGETAEISFDDSDEAPSFIDAAPEDEVFEQNGDEVAPPQKKKSPFASLFSKRAKQDPIAPEMSFGENSDEFFADVEVTEATEDEPYESEPAQAEFAPEEFDRHERAAELHRFDEEESDRKWRAAEDERKRRLAEEERRRAESEARARNEEIERAHFAAHPELARPTAHEDLARTLSEVEEALHVQREAIQAETRSLLDSFARRFSERIDSLASSFENRNVQRLHDAGGGYGREAELFEAINARLDAQGRDIADALNALSHRLESAAPASEIAALREEVTHLRQNVRSPSFGPSAPMLQLEDVVRDALSPNGYEFNAALTNNYRADCLIKLARPPGPIAIDARFPVEAFSSLHLARDPGAENEFRRISLRHIVSVAERLIAPGFTADSAMLFIPSESMAAELYSRFPDIIQDAYRARVWIVSPTTLMATLHALGGVLRGAPVREHSTAALDDARRALAEIDRLEARLSALEIDDGRQRDYTAESRSDREAGHVRLASTNESQRSGGGGIHNTLERADLSPNGDLYGEEADDNAPRQSARTPFPLR